ncbi:hypothetical protein L9F63_016875, partial [Diploptera punctata]
IPRNELSNCYDCQNEKAYSKDILLGLKKKYGLQVGGCASGWKPTKLRFLFIKNFKWEYVIKIERVFFFHS